MVNRQIRVEKIIGTVKCVARQWHNKRRPNICYFIAVGYTTLDRLRPVFTFSMGTYFFFPFSYLHSVQQVILKAAYTLVDRR